MPKPLEPSPVLARITVALDLGIPYQMITSIPYSDLLALIVESQIKLTLSNRKQKETDRLEKLGIERTEANEQDYKDFFS